MKEIHTQRREEKQTCTKFGITLGSGFHGRRKGVSEYRDSDYERREEEAMDNEIETKEEVTEGNNGG